MHRARQIGLLVSILALMLAFQNCEELESGRFSSSGLSMSGGQPYDGKVFVVEENCTDGTEVKSRFVLNDSGATLYRDNCQTIAPKAISKSELELRSEGDKIAYAGALYSMERPAIYLNPIVRWFYQLTGILVSRPPSIYIIDMFDSSGETISRLKSEGHQVICSVSSGTVENWRPDVSQFQSADIGRLAHGTRTERWLDTRSANVRNIMLSRLDIAKSKGCEGIDFDSVDAFTNDSGFPLTRETQLDYNLFLAFAAHDRKLILSLNNVPELSADLAGMFDFAIVEQCFQYDECDKYAPFAVRRKPILATEYTGYSQAQCEQAKSFSLSLAFFSEALDGQNYAYCD